MKKLLIYILIINLYTTAIAQENKLTAGLSLGTVMGNSLCINVPFYYKLNNKFIIESGISNTIVRHKLEYTSFQFNGTEVIENSNKKIIRFYMPGIPVTMNYKLKSFNFGAGFWLNYKFRESVIFKGTDYRYTTDYNKIYLLMLLKAGWQHKLTNKTDFFTEIIIIPTTRQLLPALALTVGIKLNNKVLNE